MKNSRKPRGVTKAEWLEAGLKLVSQMGTAGLSVEALSRAVGVARAGFYWHFQNRQELLDQLLDYWIQETTEVVTASPDLLGLEPKRRLLTTAELVLKRKLGQYDMPIRQWALSEPAAARAVKRVNRMRLDFIREAFRELGFTGDELEMRTMLFVCYHTWESTMFREISRERRRELIAKRLNLLTSK